MTSYISLCLKDQFKAGAKSYNGKNFGFRAKYLDCVVHSLTGSVSLDRLFQLMGFNFSYRIFMSLNDAPTFKILWLKNPTISVRFFSLLLFICGMTRTHPWQHVLTPGSRKFLPRKIRQ